MTDCNNAEMRDLLPDLVNDRLSLGDRTRLNAHLAECADCTDELALIQSARAIRPVAPTLDVSAIVAQLPKHRAVAPRRLGVWRMAATLGVIIAGGWSVLMVQSGGIGFMNNTRTDSTRLSDVPAVIDSNAAGVLTPTAAVSFGGLGDYSDEELQGVLDRLENWDGSTSTETVTTAPILPMNRGGTP